MEYSNNSHISTHHDVMAFAKHLVSDCHLSFHPDDDFADYFTNANQDKIALYNRLNDECFAVCETAGIDIYQIHLQLQQEQLLNALN